MPARYASTIFETERPRRLAYRLARETIDLSTLKVSFDILYVFYQYNCTYRMQLDGILRGGCLPPLFGCGYQRGPINNRPQLNKLPHNQTEEGRQHCRYISAARAAVLLPVIVIHVGREGCEDGVSGAGIRCVPTADAVPQNAIQLFRRRGVWNIEAHS